MGKITIKKLYIKYYEGHEGHKGQYTTRQDSVSVIIETLARITYIAEKPKRTLLYCQGCPFNSINAPCIIKAVLEEALKTNPDGPVVGTRFMDWGQMLENYTIPGDKLARCSISNND